MTKETTYEHAGIKVMFEPDSKRFRVEWGKLAEDDTHEEYHDSFAAATAEIDKVLANQRKQAKLSTALPVLIVRRNRWGWRDETPPQPEQATLSGIHKGTSALLFSGAHKKIDDSVDTYPNTKWVEGLLEKLHHLKTETAAIEVLLRKIEITPNKLGHRRSRIDAEDYPKVFEDLVALHGKMEALANELEKNPEAQTAAQNEEED